MGKMMKGIRGKILISSMLVLLLTLGSISSIVIYQVNNKAYDDYYSNSAEQMKIVSQAINIFYQQIDKNIEMLATNPTIMRADDSITTYKDTKEDTLMTPSSNEGIEQEIYKVFEQYAASHEGTSYVYLGTENGGYIQWPEESMTAGFDPSKRPWFKDAVTKNGSIIRTAPYTYKSQLLTSNARTFTDKNGKILGAIGIDVQPSDISDMLSEMKTGDTGYSMIVHSTGIIMADGKYPENNFKSIQDIGVVGLDKLLAADSVSFRVNINGEKYIVNPYKVEGTDWILASFITVKEIESSAREMVRTVTISAASLLLLTIVLFYLVSESITKPIISVTNRMKNFADLDFSTNDQANVMKYSNKKDETGDMVRALSVMRDNVAQFISKTADAAEQIAASSEELTATSEQAATASDEVSRAIEEIARGAAEQAKDTETTAHNVEEMGVLLEEDATYIRELNIATNQIEQQREEGNIILKELIDKNKSNNSATNNVYQIILTNNESVEKIEIASTMIQSLADQTNLLSLNAAIEAARAGESGKGFAVVADEIRKLSVQSNNFTEQIKKVISELKINSSNAVNLMQAAKQIVDEQTESVEATEGKFAGIGGEIDTMKDIINKLNHSAELMNKNKNKVIELTQNLAAISEENAAGTQQASASMEEQAATIDDIAKSGESLAGIAEELRIIIDRFKI